MSGVFLSRWKISSIWDFELGAHCKTINKSMIRSVSAFHLSSAAICLCSWRKWAISKSSWWHGKMIHDHRIPFTVTLNFWIFLFYFIFSSKERNCFVSGPVLILCHLSIGVSQYQSFTFQKLPSVKYGPFHSKLQNHYHHSDFVSSRYVSVESRKNPVTQNIIFIVDTKKTHTLLPSVITGDDIIDIK